jgi:3-deoxy-manno-octulosonate cytidylyltransferase (CMP-KDO synthetase)
MNIEDIRTLNNQMIKNQSQMGTLASQIVNEEFYNNQNVVKVITKESLNGINFPEAKNFLRKNLKEKENIYHHLGIYCYKLETLEKFVSLNQSSNEIKDRLEQMRALDNNIKVNVALAKSSPLGVDTNEDFVEIKKIMEYKS